MKVIVAGSRSITDYFVVETAIKESGFKIDELVCGGAKGVDSLGRDWAFLNSIPVKEFPANWNLHGKRAGYIRNSAMVEYADALIAIWDGESKGTYHTIGLAVKHGLDYYVKEVKIKEKI